MALFPQSTAKILAAFGVAALSLSAPAAMAQSNDASVQSESGYPVLTSEEALEQSNGKVLLHVGEGFIAEEINAIIHVLEEEGINISASYGSNNVDEITVFFYGNEIPRTYNSNDTDLMMVTIKQLAQKYNLIAEPTSPTSP